MPQIYNIIALWCVDSFRDVLVHSASPVLKARLLGGRSNRLAHARTIVVEGQRQLQQRSIRLVYNTFLCLRRFKPRVGWCSGMDSPKPKRAPSSARQRTARTTPSPDLPLIRGTNAAAVAACARARSLPRSGLARLLNGKLRFSSSLTPSSIPMQYPPPSPCPPALRASGHMRARASGGSTRRWRRRRRRRRQW